ncbi:MAG: hypothetical protein QM492_01735, partial [Rhodobacterales bacterium]
QSGFQNSGEKIIDRFAEANRLEAGGLNPLGGKSNGQLEAILDLSGNSKQNADVILASGYRGEGEQRLAASVTTGQSSVWQSIREIVFG